MISVSKLSLIGLLFGNICVINGWTAPPPPSTWGPSPQWTTPQWGWSPSPPPQWTVPPIPQWSQWAWQPSQTNVDQVSTNQYQSGGNSQLDVLQETFPPGWSSSSIWHPPATQWEFHSSDSWEQQGQDQWIHHLADTWEYNQETHQWEIQNHSQLWSKTQSGNSFVWVQSSSDSAAGQSSSETTSHQQSPGSYVDTHSSSNQWYENSQSNWQTVTHQG